MHLVEVVSCLVDFGIEQVLLGCDNLEVGARAHLVEVAGVVNILGEHLYTFAIDDALLVAAVIERKGIADF